MAQNNRIENEGITRKPTSTGGFYISTLPIKIKITNTSFHMSGNYTAVVAG